jgi:hypothetical protein
MRGRRRPTVIIIVLAVIAAAIVGAPIAVALLVGVASRVEDADWTLCGPPPGRLTAAARRIVDFHGSGTGWPCPGWRDTDRVRAYGDLIEAPPDFPTIAQDDQWFVPLSR